MSQQPASEPTSASKPRLLDRLRTLISRLHIAKRLRSIRDEHVALAPFVRIAGAAYAVLGLFALAFVVIRTGWGLSVSPAIQLAALVAAPAALALVWNRLSGLKVYGIEVSLTPASTQLQAGLVDAVMVQYYSDNPELIKLISNFLIQQRQELVEIPLRRPAEPYWWSTRLFLISALADDYSSLRAFVFVDEEDGRHFLGLASPARVRVAFGSQFPSLEAAYETLRANFHATDPANKQVEQIITLWTGFGFSQDGRQVTEEEFRVRVNRVCLIEWMSKAGGLDHRYVRWKGFQDRALLSKIVGFDARYVPLVEHGRLYKVVRRHAVAEEIAAKALS